MVGMLFLLERRKTEKFGRHVVRRCVANAIGHRNRRDPEPVRRPADALPQPETQLDDRAVKRSAKRRKGRFYRCHRQSSLSANAASIRCRCCQRCVRSEDVPLRRADRLFDILRLLRAAAGPLTASELADALEVTPRTIYRDLAALQSRRIPIEGVAGIG